MSSRLYLSLGLFLLLSMGRWAAGAQEPLTLRQAINVALGKSPEAVIARADNQEAKSTASLARTQLLPQLNFTEDISRGDDPVYAFGTAHSIYSSQTQTGDQLVLCVAEEMERQLQRLTDPRSEAAGVSTIASAVIAGAALLREKPRPFKTDLN